MVKLEAKSVALTNSSLSQCQQGAVQNSRHAVGWRLGKLRHLAIVTAEIEDIGGLRKNLRKHIEELPVYNWSHFEEKSFCYYPGKLVRNSAY